MYQERRRTRKCVLNERTSGLPANIRDQRLAEKALQK
jgi:hypothetical protein